MSNQQKNGSIIAIVTMMFLYAMISFVTNLGAPIGVIWKNQPEIGGSNVLGIMGNFMNFFAYLFMGIPAGKMLTKVGYKKTALIGIAVGFVGVLIQFLSGFSGGIPGFCVYLFGAFVSGFSVCILNTVVNPMLNLLGGGGNRGNQLNMIGGTLNSLAGTMTPMLVGALIGTVTASTQMADVNLHSGSRVGKSYCRDQVRTFAMVVPPLSARCHRHIRLCRCRSRHSWWFELLSIRY